MVLLAVLHAVAMVMVRPMFQVSDEVAYFSVVQVAALDGVSDQAARLRLAPPDGMSIEGYIGGRPLFRRSVGRLYAWITNVASPPSAAVLLRLVLASSLPITVFLTFLVAREVAPSQPLVTTGAPLLVALHPVFVAYAAAITPDSLANALSALALWLLLRFASGTARRLEPVALPVVCLLALLMKDTASFLVVALALGIAARGRTMRERFGSWREASQRDPWLAAAALVMIVLPLLLVGRVRALVLDATSAMLASPAPAVEPTEGRLLLALRQPVWIFSSFWGNLANFGGNEVVLPTGALVLLAVACTLGGAGLVALVAKPAQRNPEAVASESTRCHVLLLLACAAVVALQAPVRDFAVGAVGAQQGRWLFPMMGPLMVLLCLGWSRLLGGGARALPLVGLVFGTIAVMALVGVLIPTFYESFPAVYHWQNFFLLGPYGREIETARVMAFVRRPAWQQSSWIAGLPVALFVAAVFSWPICQYRALRKAARRRATGWPSTLGLWSTPPRKAPADSACNR